MNTSSTLELNQTVTYTKTPRNKPAAPTETPPPPPSVAVPTADELLKGQQEVYRKMWGKEMPDTPAPTPAASPPPETPPSPEPKVAPPVAEPDRASTEAEPKPESEPSNAELIAQSARATAEAIAPLLKQAEAPKPTAPAFEMSPEDQQDYETLLYLEKTDPKNWSGKPAAYLAYLKAHYAYQDDWMEKNPKQEFDPDDEEHKDWYDKHRPDIEPEMLKEARIRMSAEKAAMDKVQPVLDQINRDKAVQEAMPKIAATVTGLIVDMVDRAEPELGALLRKDGKPNVTLEAIAAVEAKSRIGKRILDDVVKFEMEPLLLQLEMSADPRFGVALNPAVNQIHARIDQYREKAEADMLNAPLQVQVQDGRAFSTIAQMQQMRSAIERGTGTTEEKNRQIAGLNARYYTLTVDDIEALIVRDCANLAKKRIAQAREDARIEFGPATLNGQNQPAPQAQPAPPQPAYTPRPSTSSRPPSMSSSSDMLTTPAAGDAPAKKLEEIVIEKMFGR